jgi:vesicle transport through interaction with t-SNAREs protein 1
MAGAVNGSFRKSFVHSMSSAFSMYDEMVETCIHDVRTFIGDSLATGSPAQLTAARGKIDQGNSALTELQRELFLLPTNDRSAAQRRYQELRTRLAEAEQSLTSETQRLQLLGPNTYDVHRAATVDQALAKTAQFTEESVEIGHRIITNLGDQRQKLAHAHGNVDLINTSVDSTSGVLGKMESTQRQNNLIKMGVVALMIIAMLIILYLKFFK